MTVGRGGTPEQVLQRALDEIERRKSKGLSCDWTICVFDVDKHHRISSVIAEADKQGIQVVISNLKFENWLLWHVSKSRSELNSNELDRKMRKYILLDKKHLANDFPIERYNEAIESAKLADPLTGFNREGPNPSSAMPALIEKILKG